MSRFISSISLIFLLCLNLYSQEKVINDAFGPGESLKYKVTYHSFLGNFDAGKAEVSVNKSVLEGKPVFHIVGKGETNNFFDVFYKVRDQFESKVDTTTLLPYYYLRSTKEGDYNFNDAVVFDRSENVATSSRNSMEIPNDVHDIVSAVFYMRTLSVEDFGSDSLFHVNFYLDDSVYSSVILFEGKGIVETKWGWLRCLKVKPMLVEGEVFSEKYPMTVWVTDDQNHIPVLGESEIIVGKVRMELTDYDGLKTPFQKPLSKKELKTIRNM